MLGPIIESFGWVKAHNPRTMLKTKNLNFITIHCTFHLSNSLGTSLSSPIDLYILSAVLVGSILLYPAGGMPYIDALFFASGAATQSGLNTYASIPAYEMFYAKLD